MPCRARGLAIGRSPAKALRVPARLTGTPRQARARGTTHTRSNTPRYSAPYRTPTLERETSTRPYTAHMHMHRGAAHWAHDLGLCNTPPPCTQRKLQRAHTNRPGEQGPVQSGFGFPDELPNLTAPEKRATHTPWYNDGRKRGSRVRAALLPTHCQTLPPPPHAPPPHPQRHHHWGLTHARKHATFQQGSRGTLTRHRCCTAPEGTTGRDPACQLGTETPQGTARRSHSARRPSTRSSRRTPHRTR